MTEFKQKYTDISNLYSDSEKWIGSQTTVNGWIKTCRIAGGKGKKIGFVKLSDGSCLQHLQIIFDCKSLKNENLDYFDDLYKRGKTGMSLKVNGLIVKSPKDEQPIEMQATTYEIMGDVQDPETYPIPKTELLMDFLRQVPHLRIRTDTFSSITRIKSVLKLACSEYFDKIGFAEVQLPLITDNECESGACPFSVTTILGDGKLTSIPVKDDNQTINFQEDFFKKRCYLTVSGQLHLESLVLGGISKAWGMTTAFRAEKSLGPRHLAELWMLELEFCFGTLEDNMEINEGCIKHCLKRVLEKCHQELEFIQNKFKPGLINLLQKYISTPFIRTSHEECVKLMLKDEEEGKIKFEISPGYEDDFTKEHERYITEKLFDGSPVFVCYFPAKIKSFYMPVINEGHKIPRVDCFDLLVPEIGEIIGGSQRETDYDKLIKRMKEAGINPVTLKFYSDLRKYGTVPHGGSGIGFDRFLLFITGGLTFNIRDMVPFPRTYETCLC